MMNRDSTLSGCAEVAHSATTLSIVEGISHSSNPPIQIRQPYPCPLATITGQSNMCTVTLALRYSETLIFADDGKVNPVNFINNFERLIKMIALSEEDKIEYFIKYLGNTVRD